MNRRRFLVAALGLVAASSVRPALAAAPVAPATVAPAVAPIRSFYDVLLSAMKDGQKLGFAGRRARLAPVIRQTFDFPLMTRLIVGPQWAGIAPTQQQQIITYFSAFSIATWANRFDDYSGEQFDVDEAPVPTGNGDAIVRSQLVQQSGDKVDLDYLMHNGDAGWKVIDIYLSGTVSELATRRSEFSSVMRRGGPEALVDLLQRKVQELSS